MKEKTIYNYLESQALKQNVEFWLEVFIFASGMMVKTVFGLGEHVIVQVWMSRF